MLFKTARQKKVSAGELLRAALEALSDGSAAASPKAGLRATAGKGSRKLAKNASDRKPTVRRK